MKQRGAPLLPAQF